jgi:glutamyl-tRNA synthetase
MNEGVVGRLAPSPTGALHLGNARSFLLAWLSVRQQAGRLLLRIEDIDSPRVKPWARQATLDDLKWLGLDWDAGPGAASPQLWNAEPPLSYVQTERLPRYHSVLAQLIEAGMVYPCTCTRSEVAQAASAPHESSIVALEGPIYPGTCRDKPFNPHPIDQLEKFAWRWRFKPGPVVWHDEIQGALTACPAEQLGDFVIARSDGTPAYQLAVVVDDHDMGVTEIVRGDDLLCSTYRQLAILQHLGWPTPTYYHVPLMVGPDGRRLAKRHGDTRLSHFRQQGMTAEQVVGYLAWTLRLQPEPQPLSPYDLIGRLDWKMLPKHPTTVNAAEPQLHFDTSPQRQC